MPLVPVQPELVCFYLSGDGRGQACGPARVHVGEAFEVGVEKDGDYQPDESGTGQRAAASHASSSSTERRETSVSLPALRFTVTPV